MGWRDVGRRRGRRTIQRRCNGYSSPSRRNVRRRRGRRTIHQYRNSGSRSGGRNVRGRNRRRTVHQRCNRTAGCPRVWCKTAAKLYRCYYAQNPSSNFPSHRWLLCLRSPLGAGGKVKKPSRSTGSRTALLRKASSERRDCEGQRAERKSTSGGGGERLSDGTGGTYGAEVIRGRKDGA
jgi:hypothetical protein